jgi:hypothetical protein
VLLIYAATWKRLAMNFACPIAPLPFNVLTCPFLVMLIASTPWMVRSAVSNERIALDICFCNRTVFGLFPSSSRVAVSKFPMLLRNFPRTTAVKGVRMFAGLKGFRPVRARGRVESGLHITLARRRAERSAAAHFSDTGGRKQPLCLIRNRASAI